LSELWHLVSSLYKPWIQPLKLTDPDLLLLPWIPDDADVAKEMVATWAASVSHMQEQFHSRLMLDLCCLLTSLCLHSNHTHQYNRPRLWLGFHCIDTLLLNNPFRVANCLLWPVPTFSGHFSPLQWSVKSCWFGYTTSYSPCYTCEQCSLPLA